MALPVTGKVLLDTNVFIDYLRADLYADWISVVLATSFVFSPPSCCWNSALAPTPRGATERSIVYKPLFLRAA